MKSQQGVRQKSKLRLREISIPSINVPQFIHSSIKKGWNFFFSGAARRLEANDYLTKAIQIRELFWDYKGLVIILEQAGSFSPVLEGLSF